MPIVTPIFSRQTGTPTVPQFAEIAIKGHSVESDGGSKPFVNLFNFVRVSGPGTMTEVDLYGVFVGAIGPTYGNCLSVFYVGDTVDVRFMDDPTRAGVANVSALGGMVPGDRLPNYAASVIRKVTFARGRSFRGSNHYGPIAEDNTTLDNLTLGAFGQLGTFGAVLVGMGGLAGGLTTPDGSIWRLCVFSPTLSDYASNPIQVTGSWVKSVVINRRLGTMKRRKDRTGTSA